MEIVEELQQFAEQHNVIERTKESFARVFEIEREEEKNEEFLALRYSDLTFIVQRVTYYLTWPPDDELWYAGVYLQVMNGEQEVVLYSVLYLADGKVFDDAFIFRNDHLKME